jgi:superfamily I DNA and/or RNA helicase
MAVIYREIAKKKRHLPIRKLLHEAGHALQAIKLVFMMSPISIAQFLAPGTLEFDLLVMDEASQVTPEDALGAIARAKQIVVVGDSKQLPPTRFFTKMLGDEAFSEDDEITNTGDVESILKLCESKGLPQRMLRWHYRNRHQSLIAVSNREFYDNELYVIPSPESISPDYGLHFRFIGDGVFDRGGKASNQLEARAVAQAVIEHARQVPDKSLGVGTFSVAQRDAVLNELELMRRANSGLEKFFASGKVESVKSEPFFVKNLENIQGDERDVIFISVGYGKDQSGFMAMNFGPLSLEGGERRLNVLITRARERCEVFSSITADDINTDRASAVGARALKNFPTLCKNRSARQPRLGEPRI